MIDSMGLKLITILPSSWSFTLLRKVLVGAIIAGPFLLGGVHGFVLGKDFIFKVAMRYRQDKALS